MAEIMTACPKCTGMDIRERNVAYANLRINGWERNEETGEPEPTEIDGDESAEWFTDEGDPYVCADCQWTGSAHELVVWVDGKRETADADATGVR